MRPSRIRAREKRLFGGNAGGRAHARPSAFPAPAPDEAATVLSIATPSCRFMGGLERVIVAVAIVRHEGRVLVQRRDRSPFAGRWEFPGGKVAPGECPEAAAVRECAEERGIDVVVVRPLAVVRHDYASLAPAVEIHAFLARLAEGQDPADAVRNGAARWVEEAALASIEMPDANEVLVREMIGRAVPGERGIRMSRRLSGEDTFRRSIDRR